MDVGTQIKEARKRAGLTQAQLAEKSGVAAISIHQYESGKRRPQVDRLLRIAAALDVSVDHLLGLRPLPDNLAEVFLNRDIGQNIRDLRKAVGMTQKELSEKTGIPLKYIQSFERGTGGYFPTSEDLLRISEVFGIIPEHLKGTSVTQEWMLETMERNKRLQEDDPPVRNITFNVTPDPEWVELNRKLEDGTITPDELQRNKDLMKQASENSRKRLSMAQQRILDLIEMLSDSDMRVVTAMLEQLIAERMSATEKPIPSEPEGKDTTASEHPPEPLKNGG